MRLFERATQINEQVLQPGERETARASWFIRELLPLSGYGSDDAELFERVLAIRGEQRGLADPPRQKASAISRRCCPPPKITAEHDRCSNGRSKRRRGSWARTIRKSEPPPAISPMCCRAPARTTGRSGCTSAR